MLSEYFYSAFNLLVVLALAFSLLFFVKKSKLNKFNKNKLINIIQVVPIGAKEKIILVEVYGSFILLGATATNIQMLHVFNQSESEEMNPIAADSVEKFSLSETVRQMKSQEI